MRNPNKQLSRKTKIATVAAIATIALGGGAKVFESGPGDQEQTPLDEQTSALVSRLADHAGSIVLQAQASDPESVSITHSVQPEAPEGSSDYTRAQFDKDGYFITVDYAGDTTDPSTAKMVSFSYAQGDQSDFLTIQTEPASSQDWTVTEQRHVNSGLSDNQRLSRQKIRPLPIMQLTPLAAIFPARSHSTKMR